MKSIKDIFNRRVAVALLVPVLAAGALVTSGCGSQPADVVSNNLSKSADNFRIEREIDVINTVTGEHIMSIRGLCSLGNDDPPERLSVTCKTGEDELGNGKYIKDFIFLPPTVTVLVQQLGSAEVSDAHYSVTWNPGTLVPDFNKAGGEPLTPSQPDSTASSKQEKTASNSPKTKIVPLPGKTVTVEATG